MEKIPEYPLYATCPDELTELLADEISALGGREVRSGYRVVYFNATKEVAYRAHLHLRLASRICRILKEIPAQSPRIIFDKARKIRFHEYFTAEQPISIHVAAANDGGKIATHLIGSKLREAVNDCFEHYQKISPNQSAYKAALGISGYYHQNRLMVSLDTSNESLHRRGFRVEGHPAPLKETLAAACLAVCEYDGTLPFYDPMCGSGTIVVEAAQIAMHRAPLIHRQKGGFGLEHLRDFDPRLWQSVRAEAVRNERPVKVGIYGSDIEDKFVRIAQETAANAHLEAVVRLETRDFFKTEKPAEQGLLIANIPYGLRMNEKEVSGEFLKAVGEHLKHHFKGWRCGILAPSSSPLKEIRLKPQKKASFMNGTVPVKLVVFDIF